MTICGKFAQNGTNIDSPRIRPRQTVVRLLLYMAIDSLLSASLMISTYSQLSDELQHRVTHTSTGTHSQDIQAQLCCFDTNLEGTHWHPTLAIVGALVVSIAPRTINGDGDEMKQANKHPSSTPDTCLYDWIAYQPYKHTQTHPLLYPDTYVGYLNVRIVITRY